MDDLYEKIQRYPNNVTPRQLIDLLKAMVLYTEKLKVIMKYTKGRVIDLSPFRSGRTLFGFAL